MNIQETQDGKLSTEFKNETLTIDYLSYTTGSEYRRVIVPPELYVLHELISIDISYINDFIEKEAKIEVKADVVNAYYTMKLGRRNYNISIDIPCSDAGNRDIANLQRQNRLLSNRVSELQSEMDNVSNKLNKFLRIFATLQWNHGDFSVNTLQIMDSKLFTDLNELIEVKDVSIGDENQFIYDLLISGDEKKCAKGIELNGNSNICNNDGLYALDKVLEHYRAPFKIVKLLVENKANVNRRINGQTCLTTCNNHLYRIQNNKTKERQELYTNMNNIITLLRAKGAV